MAKKDQKDQKEALPAIQNSEQLVSAVEKKFGSGAIMMAGSRPVLAIPAISTGAIGLDIALGIGGIPRGRVTEIYGAESGGKTTLTLSIIRQAQLAGGVAAFIDAEHALDLGWAKANGVNLDTLLISQPDSGEQALNIVEMLVQSHKVDTIVVDSVAALIPQAEIDAEIGANVIGAQARLMSLGLRKLTGICSKSNCAIVFINQIRSKIGVMFGNPETTPGGRALKFYASVRLDVHKKGVLKAGEIAIGNDTIVKVVKNKCAPPFRTATFALYFGKDGYPSGIDFAASVVDLGLECGVLTKSSSYVVYGDQKLANGVGNTATMLRGNPDLLKEIESKIRESYNPVVVPGEADDGEEPEE